MRASARPPRTNARTARRAARRCCAVAAGPGWPLLASRAARWPAGPTAPAASRPRRRGRGELEACAAPHHRAAGVTAEARRRAPPGQHAPPPPPPAGSSAASRAPPPPSAARRAPASAWPAEREPGRSSAGDTRAAATPRRRVRGIALAAASGAGVTEGAARAVDTATPRAARRSAEAHPPRHRGEYHVSAPRAQSLKPLDGYHTGRAAARASPSSTMPAEAAARTRARQGHVDAREAA